MIPVTPETVPEGTTLVVFGQNQTDADGRLLYHGLPGVVTRHENFAVVVTEWEPSAEELDRICRGGRIRVALMMFSEGLTPLKVEA